jgi:putative aldouronate transport system substrate-binding protein
MRGKKISKIGITLTFLSLGGLVAGCSQNTNNTTTNSNTNSDTTIPTIDQTWKFPFQKMSPVAKQKVTLSMFMPANPNVPDFNKLKIFQDLENNTNVHINWVSGQLNTLIAGGDLPDAFVNAGFTPQQLAQYGQDGAFLSWNQYLKYMPNVEKIFKEYPSLKTISTAPNGQIYSLPGGEGFGIGHTSIFADHHFLFINKKYLDQIHQPVPTTLTQLHDDLLAFKTKLGVSIPMSFNEQAWAGDIAQLFGGFGLPDNLEHIVVRNGKVIFTAAQPEYKTAIDYFNSWVKEGLIDPEALTEKPEQYAAKEASGKLGAFIDWDETPADNHQQDYVLVGPLAGPTGTVDVGFDNFYWAGPGAFVMTKSNPDPVLTAKWINLVYAPYQASQMHWGPAGNDQNDIFNMNKNGELVFSSFYKTLDNYGAYRGKVSANMGVILPDWLNTYVAPEPRAQVRLDRIKNVFAPHMEEQHYPFGAVYFTPEENSQLTTLQTNINNYVNQNRATWLLKGGADQQWDSYSATLNNMGLKQYLNILQTALDRYVKAGGKLTD